MKIEFGKPFVIWLLLVDLDDRRTKMIDEYEPVLVTKEEKIKELKEKIDDLKLFELHVLEHRAERDSWQKRLDDQREEH